MSILPDDVVSERGVSDLRSVLRDKGDDVLPAQDVPPSSLLREITQAHGDPFLSTSKARLLVTCVLCLEQDVEILKPRPHHRAVVDDLRQKTRTQYYRKMPKSKTRKQKFSFEENVPLNLQRHVVGIFVGRQGRNLRKITDKVDCQVTVQRGATVTVTVTIKARSYSDLFWAECLLADHAASVMRRRRQMAGLVGIYN